MTQKSHCWVFIQRNLVISWSTFLPELFLISKTFLGFSSPIQALCFYRELAMPFLKKIPIFCWRKKCFVFYPLQPLFSSGTHCVLICALISGLLRVVLYQFYHQGYLCTYFIFITDSKLLSNVSGPYDLCTCHSHTRPMFSRWRLLMCL